MKSVGNAMTPDAEGAKRADFVVSDGRGHGSPGRGVHSVQIEINRALYLDEGKVEKSDGFEELARHLEQLSKFLTAL